MTLIVVVVSFVIDIMKQSNTFVVKTAKELEKICEWRVQRKSDLKYNYYYTREEMLASMKRQRSEWGERFSRVEKKNLEYNHWRRYFHKRGAKNDV